MLDLSIIFAIDRNEHKNLAEAEGWTHPQESQIQ